jgi:hypothetical protein
LSVFVLDKRKQPPMPCSEKRARLLLERGRAVVVRRYAFTIRIKDRIGGETQSVRVKIDPGSKVTGLALVGNEGTNHPAIVLSLIELAHRGRQISEALTARRGFRRRRRNANLRDREPLPVADRVASGTGAVPIACQIAGERTKGRRKSMSPLPGVDDLRRWIGLGSP